MNTEREFAKDFIAKMHKEGSRAIRIETGSTQVGVPDILLFVPGCITFVELKNCKDKSILDRHITVPWRPGQQAFAAIHRMYTMRNTWTLVACKDGVLVIKMDREFENNKVDVADSSVFRFTYSEWKEFSFSSFVFSAFNIK